MWNVHLCTTTFMSEVSHACATCVRSPPTDCYAHKPATFSASLLRLISVTGNSIDKRTQSECAAPRVARPSAGRDGRRDETQTMVAVIVSMLVTARVLLLLSVAPASWPEVLSAVVLC